MSVKTKVISSSRGDYFPACQSPSRDTVSRSMSIQVHRKDGKAVPIDPTTQAFTCAVREAVKAQRASNLPVAKYDTKARKAYLEYADGEREYITAP